MKNIYKIHKKSKKLKNLYMISKIDDLYDNL